MKIIQKYALYFAIAFLVVFIITNIPAFNDSEGRNFGLFKIDTIDNFVHLLTAVLGFIAVWRSPRASAMFLLVFGILYEADAAVGLFLSRGLLDTSVFFSIGSPDFSMNNILLNLPHIVIATVMIRLGYKYRN